MTALAGTIPFQIGGLKSNIEIVRRIPGASGSVEALAVQAEWDGKTIRVLHPISLLACKLEMAASVAQEKRHDVALPESGHVRRDRKIANEHQINWLEILPLTAIAKSQHEKIRRFQEQQLEQGSRKSKGISI